MLYYISGGLQVSDGRGHSWIVPEHAINPEFVYKINELLNFTGDETQLIPQLDNPKYTNEEVITWIEKLINFSPRNQKEKEFVNSKILEFRRRFCGTTTPTPSFVWKLHE